MEMVKLLVACVLLPTAWGADFSLTIGPAVAAGTGGAVKKTKGAQCSRCGWRTARTPAKASIAGTAENLTNGTRSSVPVMLDEAGTVGVYVVSQSWGFEGAWAVSLVATCGKAKAGAIVPIGPQGFLRESTKVFPRPATPAEINAVLETLNKH